MQNRDQRKRNANEEPVSNESTTQSGRLNEATEAARQNAMEDIEQDADLSIHSPNDDLDEGETARLGEDKTDLV